jgi:excisionase family DNA binding protein
MTGISNKATGVAASPESECLCAEDLARFLGVNRKTVYEYAARRVIPHQRLGRRLIFSRSQVLVWLGARSDRATLP